MKRLFLLLIILFQLSHSQNVDSIEVEITSDIVEYKTINCLFVEGQLYFSIDDFGEVLSLPIYRNNVLKKGELNIGDYLIKFSNNNRFVTITNQLNYKRWVEQINNPIIFQNSEIYAPAYLIKEKLEKFINVTFNYDTTLNFRSSSQIKNYKFTEDENTLKIYFPVETIPTSWKLKQENTNSFSIHLFNCNVDEEYIRNQKNPESILAPFVQNENNNSTISFVFRQKLKPKDVTLQFDDSSNSILLLINKIILSDGIVVAKKTENKIQDNNLEVKKAQWKFDVVVIDPGHGGKDPGSIGITGVLEKDVTLGISQKLGELIQKNLDGIKIVYTRKNDSFVELYKRGKIANDSEGKLFISIHCNSFESEYQSPSGFEIYLLRPGKSEQAVKIAARENDVVKFEEDYQTRYKELTEENFILLTMAQSSFMKQSEEYAEILQKEMEKKLVSESRGVKQAGFYVLVGASMPNVLVETGYISNSKEEKFLNSDAGQLKVAESIFTAIKKYKTYYDEKILD